MSRREFPKSVKVAAFKRCAGRCEKCTAALTPGKFAYDHVIADALGGEPILSNCQVLCDACHGPKTAKEDIPAAAKAKRREAAHVGAVAAPAKQISSAPFPIGKGRKEHPMPMPARRSIYGARA